MQKISKIYVAGHTGLIGRAVLSRLTCDGYSNLIVKTRRELDLTSQQDVLDFFKKERPEYVILSAAKVGGINANIKQPGKFIYDNLMIQANVIHSAYLSGVKKLLFFGSACSYPRESPQPIKEEYLLGGHLEPTNKSYAVAKISGVQMCQAYCQEYGVNFISVALTNVYGPGDNFNSEDSHVIPALIKRFHRAKLHKEAEVSVWGSGEPRREFIYVDDVVDGVIFLMENYDKSEMINLCVGSAISIRGLSEMIKDMVGFSGKVLFDASRPDGMPEKILDASKLKKLGWAAKTPLREGLERTYDWYLNNQS